MDTTPSASALSLHDARPFFEKALAHGVQHGIIDAAKLAAIDADAPKGMVQIARYFGSEFLRPELEKARERMVNLVSLCLQESSGGDLQQAAEALREHSFLSRSKSGSDMLKRLIAMPESSHFGMVGHAEAQTPLLAIWSLRSHADYRAELARRSEIAQAVGAALWLAARCELDAGDLEEAGTDAESVIRTALLWRALAPRSTAWPTGAALEKALAAQRKRAAGAALAAPAVALPPQLPAPWHALVQAQCEAVRADCALLLASSDKQQRALLRPLGRLRARYFLQDDPLADVDDYERALAEGAALDGADGLDEAPAPASKTWDKATEGRQDEHALLTLFVCLAAGMPKKTLLTEKSATALLGKIGRSGFDAERATAFIRLHAPQAWADSYLALWSSFVQESQATLCSDRVGAQQEALALLRRECHVVAG
ncbi:hypothetical protein B2J88_32805 [Rhodococcus sp. SRB_17]|nr:hypothetical protein [Rhodococcus sp. SRB_17]